MPAQRPRATFEPISPDFDVKKLVESTPNFSYVDRISCDMIEQQGIAAFDKLVLLHVVIGGKPLVIDGYEDRLDPWTYTPKWLRDNCGEKHENAWDLKSKEILPLSIGHYLNNMSMLAHQFYSNPGAYKESKRQRVYLKDIDCPPVWLDKLREHVPNSLFYLNESTGEVGGPGALPEGNIPGQRLGKGIGRAGDLMSSLPSDMRAENLMCYIGHEGTYTPAHREMCASLGQNIMVEASTNVSEDGKPERPGSSIWFMTESKDRHLVSEYWLSVLGHDIEVENHFAQIAAWKKAPFHVYVVEQRPGDFILIPPLAPHQVWNRGTRTMKIAWNRTTVETLEMALNEALPRSRIVCRDEQYKNKAIVYYTLQKYSSLIALAQSQTAPMGNDSAKKFMATGKIKQITRDFRKLFNLYRQVLLSEMFNPDDREGLKSIEYVPFDGNVTCAYCRSNIFNRFLTCHSCRDVLGHSTDPEGDPYDVCMDCYTMGRSCACISNLKWVEQFRWKELTAKYDNWRKLLISLDGGQITEKTPLTIIDERKRLQKKTLAEVCKEQLKRRPWHDIRKPSQLKEDSGEEEEIVVDDNGMVKKIQKKKSKKWLQTHSACHVCKHPHPNWKMAQCSLCDRWWCYGTLFRGWDKMPIDIMSETQWSCPHCLGICFAGSCKRDGNMKPYEPKGTLLGHDTKKVADARSVEALVDFSISNLTWIRDDDPVNRAESQRLKRAGAEAQKAKNADLILEDDEEEESSEHEDSPELQQLPGGEVDPSLNTHDSHQPDVDAELARRLEEANASMTSPMAHGSNASSYPAHTPASPSLYPQPGDFLSYTYPGSSQQAAIEAIDRNSTSGHHHTSGVRPFKRRLAEDADEISMTKSAKIKKARLSAAGFRSTDLASEGTVTSSKAKTDAQKQFEKEKQRKALDKARAEGRFIMLQAAMQGKKSVVKLSIPRPKLVQLAAQQNARQAAQAALNLDLSQGKTSPHRTLESEGEFSDDGIILKSDIQNPKKPEHRRLLEQGQTKAVAQRPSKKALVPVEKDGSYGSGRAKSHATTDFATSKRRKRGRGYGSVEFEEIDIGSDEDAEPGASNRNSATARDRRSLPGYMRGRHAEEDEDEEYPAQLPSNFKDGTVERAKSRPKAAISAASQPKNGFSRKNGSSNGARPSSLIASAISGPPASSGRHPQVSTAFQSTSPMRAEKAKGMTEEEIRRAKIQALEAVVGSEKQQRAPGAVIDADSDSDDGVDAIPARGS